MTIKRMLKGHYLSNSLIKLIRKIQFVILPTITYEITFEIMRFFRITHLSKTTPYDKLKNLKNKHLGERCFIVATGPSLTIEDLEKLHNEITFSMNSICLAFEETTWRPTYYAIQDIGVFDKFEKNIELLNSKCKFIGDVIGKKRKVSDDYFIFPLNLLNHSTSHNKYHTKFSDNAFSVVYDGYTITYSIIQIAIYMGFKTIYLLGTDCNYSKDMHHHFRDYNHVDPNFLSARDKMIRAYQEAKKYADHHDIKIYNATKGGMLEVFERIDLNSVI